MSEVLNSSVLWDSFLEPMFLYVNDFLQAMSETCSYLYAYSTCVSYKCKDY